MAGIIAFPFRGCPSLNMAFRVTASALSRNQFVAHVARVVRSQRVARAQATARAKDTPLRAKRPRADAVTYAVVDRVVDAVFSTIHAELKTNGRCTAMRRHGTFEHEETTGTITYHPNGAAFKRMDVVAAEAFALAGGFDEKWAQRQADKDADAAAEA